MIKKNNSLPLIFFCIISVYLSYKNLGWNTEYAGGDSGALHILPVKAFYQSIYTWYEMCNGGTDGRINLPRLFPFLTLFTILKSINLSSLLIQRILFSLYIFIPAISMFYLLSYLLKEDFRGKMLILCMGSLFYAVNHFTMVILSHPVGLGELYVFYLVLPILSLVFIKGLKGNGQIKQAILFSLLFTIALPGNMAYTGLLIFIFGLYFLWCLLTQRNYNQMFKFIIYTAGFSIIFSFWFIIPYGDFIIRGSKNIGELFWLGNIDYLRILNTRNSLKNVFALCGEIWDNPQDIASLKPLHNNLLYIRLKYIIPLLSFSALLWYRRKKEIGFFVLLAIIAIFLAKGINPPFGGIFLWLYKYIPGYGIYRYAYDKFSVLLAFSYGLLMTISLSYLVRYISKRLIRSALYITCCSSIIISGGLFWEGKVIRWPNFFVKIPQDYYEAQRYINSQKEDSKILTFPMTSRRMKKLNWGYMGVDLFELLFNKPVLNYYDLSCILGGAEKWLLKKTHFPIISKIFNIGYLLLDTNQENMVEGSKTEKITRMYQNIFESRLSQFVSKETIFNGLRLYKIKDILSHIYTSVSPVFILGDFSIFELLCYEQYLGNNPLLIFSKQNKGLIKNTQIMAEAGLFASINKKLSMQFLNNIRSKIVYFVSGNIKQRKLFIKENGRYLFRFKLIPKYVSKKGLSSIALDFPDLINRISIDKHNSTGRYFIDGLGRLITSIYFDGGEAEDEYFQIKIKDLNIDIAQYPWIVLDYKIEDPSFQIIEIVAGVDVDNDGDIDEYIRGMYRKSPSADFYKFYNNIYRRIKAKYPDLKNAVVKEIELYPHKYWGIDCSTSQKKKYYRFWIKNIEFCSGFREPGLLKIENTGYEQIIKEALSSYRNIKFSREFDNLDVTKYPFMELEYKVGNIWTTGMDIIFNFIHKRSKITKEIKLRSIFPWQDDFCKETVDILSIMHKNRLSGKIWTLKNVEFNFYKKGGTNKIPRAWIRQLKFYGTNYIRTKGFDINKSIAKIDNHIIQFKESFKDSLSIKIGVEFSKEIYLEKGLHRFTNLIRDWATFKLEWAFIEPLGELILKQTGTLPEIKFEKINPTRYIAQVTTKNPFWLVLSESFNKQWKAYAYANGKEIKLKNHFMVNSYSNGWYISENDLRSLYKTPDRDGYKLKIIINYAPQFLFKICIYISVCSFIFVLIFIFL